MWNRQNQNTAYEPSGGKGTITIKVENGIVQQISGSPIHSQFSWGGSLTFPADCYVTGVSIS